MARSDRKALIILCLILFIFMLYLEMLAPCYFLYDDNAVQFLPYYDCDWHSVILHGKIPLVNFHQFLGYSCLGQGQSGVFYPPVYLAELLSHLIFRSDFLAIDILVMVHLIFAAIFMFLLLRKVGVNRQLGFLASLIWATSPFTILLSKSWVIVAYTAAFTPLEFIVLLSFIEKPSLKNSFLLALVKTFFFFQGNVQYLFMLCIFEVLFLLFLGLRKNGEITWKTLAYYCFSGVVTFFLSSPLFFPMLEAQKSAAFRTGGLSYEKLVSFAMSIQDFLKAQIYCFRSSIIFDCQVGSQIYYIGPFIFLSFFFLIKKHYREEMRKDKTQEFLLLALLALISTTTYYGLLHEVPGMNLFKGQFRYFNFFDFFLIIASSLIASTAIGREGRNLGRALLALFLISIVTNAAVITQKVDNTLSTRRVAELPVDYRMVFQRHGKGRIFSYWLNVPREQEYMYITDNCATLFGLYHFLGYPEPLIPKVNLLFTLNLCRGFGGPLNRKVLDHLSFWGVRYFVTEDSPENRKGSEATGQLRLIYEGHGIIVYENTRALPLAYYVEEGIFHELPCEFGINEITLCPNNDKRQDIVLSVVPLPGCFYSCDGKKADPVSTDSVPMVISVPSGTGHLTIFYRDNAFSRGMAVFEIFLALCSLYAFARWIGKRFQSGRQRI
jgi:hypothetical protein